MRSHQLLTTILCVSLYVCTFARTLAPGSIGKPAPKDGNGPKPKNGPMKTNSPMQGKPGPEFKDPAGKKGKGGKALTTPSPTSMPLHHGLVGYYLASAYVISTPAVLKAHMGIGGDVTITATTTVSKSSDSSYTYMQGSKTESMIWPLQSIPTTFTICSITKYANVNGNQQRILQSNDASSNWLHGHWTGDGVSATISPAIGKAFYGGTFIDKGLSTPADSPAGTTDPLDWVVLCGTNGATATTPSNAVLDGTPVGTFTDTTPADLQLSINPTTGGVQPTGKENSDWQFAGIMIWNRALGPSEMIAATNELKSAAK